MVQIHGTMDVFEKIFELSQFRSAFFSASIFEFKYSINQVSRPSLNSEEHPSSKKIFPTFIPLRPSPSLLIVALPWGKPATPALLALAFACHPIRNDRKQNRFPQIVILVQFLNRIFPCLWKLNLLPVLHKKFHIVLSFNGHNHCSVYRHKAHKYLLERREGYLQVSYSMFLEFSFWILVKNSK
jgi:hypothetical protein